jgi:hypothetical protein
MRRQNIAILGCLLATACPAPNGEFEGRVTLELTSSPLNPTAQVLIQTNIISIAEVRVVSDLNPEGLFLLGPSLVAVDSTVNNLGFFDAPPAFYSKTLFSVGKPSEDQELPDEFEGEPWSVFIAGSAPISDGRVVPFVFRDNSEYFLEAESLAGLSLLPGGTGRFRVIQDLNKLFSLPEFASIRTEDLAGGQFLDLDASRLVVVRPKGISTQNASDEGENSGGNGNNGNGNNGNGNNGNNGNEQAPDVSGPPDETPVDRLTRKMKDSIESSMRLTID